MRVFHKVKGFALARNIFGAMFLIDEHSERRIKLGRSDQAVLALFLQEVAHRGMSNEERDDCLYFLLSLVAVAQSEGSYIRDFIDLSSPAELVEHTLDQVERVRRLN